MQPTTGRRMPKFLRDSNLSFRRHACSRQWWLVWFSLDQERSSAINNMKLTRSRICIFVAAMLLVVSAAALATFNYDYGPDEYVTISNGISPDRKLAITTHGEGDMGYEKFHVYLLDALTGKRIGPLEEIVETLDTGAGAFGAKWARDTSEVTIVYRVDRHAPLKSMTYRLAKRQATPFTKRPGDVRDAALIKFWGEFCSNPKPPEKTFGTPKRRE